jgi:hypothetical protein
MPIFGLDLIIALYHVGLGFVNFAVVGVSISYYNI